MQIVPTTLPGVLIVESRVFGDDRGFFNEVFVSSKFHDLGLPTEFVQDNCSRSIRHTLRGLHYQLTAPQGKLVRASAGRIFDVAVDIRRHSPTFGQWFGTTLEAGDGRQLWVPPEFAHGFLVLSEHADVSYKCTTEYDHPADRSLAWNDPDIGIEWPIDAGVMPLLSPKDAVAPRLANADLFE